MFEHSTFGKVDTTLEPGDLAILYSDGITEAEDPSGQPLEESGLEQLVERHLREPAAALGHHILKGVEAHARHPRFMDDLTVLILKRGNG
jgi:sigma-B regulation protein RsbU (phosphoserine phosphatase)